MLYSTHPPCCSIVSAVLFNACNYQGYLTVTHFTQQLKECNCANCGKPFPLRLLPYESDEKHLFGADTSYHILNMELRPQMKCKMKISCFAVNVYERCKVMVAFHFCSSFMISLRLRDVITSLIVVVCSAAILSPLSPVLLCLCECINLLY